MRIKTLFTNVHPAYWISLFLVLFTVFAYGPVTGFDFVDFDDQLYVQENPTVQKGLTWTTVGWAFSTATPITGYWVPLTWLSFLVDYSIYGMHAGGYHLTNLLLHVANVLLLFTTLFRMTGAVWRSGCAAILFALHPLHVESVAWITERKDVLSTLFWFLTMLAYLRYVKKPGAVRYGVVIIFFMLGLMAKPMLVTLPVVLLLLDFWPLQRVGIYSSKLSPGETVSGQSILVEKIPMLTIAIVAGIAAFFTQKLGGAIVPVSDISLEARIANCLVAYWSYIQKMFWPVGLAGLYPHPGDIGIFKPFAAFVFLAALTVLCVRLRRSIPHVTVGWFWYLVVLAPVSGLVVIGPHAVADRYTYVPLIGLYIAIAWSFPKISGQAVKGKIFASFVAVVLISALIALTRQQVGFWKNNLNLFSRMIAVTSKNYVGHCGLGKALMKLGRYREAEKNYRLAIDIKPDYAIAHFNLGHALLINHRPAEAVNHFIKVVELQPDYPGAHLNIGVALAHCGNFNKALEHFKQEAALNINSESAYYNIANILNMYGDCRGARENLERVLEINPESRSALDFLETLERHCTAETARGNDYRLFETR